MIDRGGVARAGLLALLVVCLPAPARADVVVLANRSRQAVRYRLPGGNAAAQASSTPWTSIAVGEIATAPVVGTTTIDFLSDREERRYELEADRCYFFYEGPTGGLQLEAIGLAEERARPRGDDLATKPSAGGAERRPQSQPAASGGAGSAGLPTVQVKLLADDDEPAAAERWQAKLRARLAAASEIFERCCRVKFEAVAVGSWDSDPALDEFEELLTEFERETSPQPARLAIGFTSQYRAPEGRTHLGGVRGPLRSHILIREWSQHNSEPERLELLIHELGHFLGAVHSPEAGSVMRPMLGDRQANARSFRITFDPLNALAMCLVSEELPRSASPGLAGLSAPTRRRLRGIYQTLREALPDDPAARQYLGLLEVRRGVRDLAAPPKLRLPPLKTLPLRPPSGLTPESPSGASDLQDEFPAPGVREATRVVLQAVVAAVRENHARPLGKQAAREELFRRSGDDLTESCVRAAAAAAEELPQVVRGQAFCLALAIALESSNQLRGYPALGDLIRSIEPEAARAERVAILGQPTMRQRRDLTLHFWVSAALAAVAGPAAAEAAGVAKEWRDSDGGSGFSFCDLSADLAGIALAEKLRAGKLSFQSLRREFEVAACLPPVEGLEEGLSREEFCRRYGSTSDGRFLEAKRRMAERIEAGYEKP